MVGYLQSTLKTLFGLSMNVCAFRDERESACEQRLIDTDWKSVKARISHICAARPKGPRYDVNMTEKQRYAFENLILLCPTHHVQVDDLEPDRFTVEVLTKMKNDAIERAGSETTWAEHNDALIDRAVERLIVVMNRENSLEPLPPMSMGEPAIIHGSGKIQATFTASAAGTVKHEVIRGAHDESMNNHSA
jgi:hypothetical protein